MLVYFEDLLVEHLAGAISSVGTEWQKGNRMERKKTKHVNNAESKNQKNKLKIRQKKKRETTFLDRCVWVWKLKNMEKANKKILRRDDGWGEDGLKHASESPAGERTIAV